MPSIKRTERRATTAEAEGAANHGPASHLRARPSLPRPRLVPRHRHVACALSAGPAKSGRGVTIRIGAGGYGGHGRRQRNACSTKMEVLGTASDAWWWLTIQRAWLHKGRGGGTRGRRWGKVVAGRWHPTHACLDGGTHRLRTTRILARAASSGCRQWGEERGGVGGGSRRVRSAAGREAAPGAAPGAEATHGERKRIERKKQK